MFLIGMTLYDMRDRFRWWHGGLLLLCCTEIAVQQWAWKMQDATHPGWPYVGVIALSAAAVFAASRWRVPLLTSRPIVFLGTISYSWYLIHQNIGYAMIRWVESKGGHVMLGVGVAFVSCISIAYALTRLVEQPANRWLRRVLIRKPGSDAMRPGATPQTHAPPTSQVTSSIEPT
jgi:peptidoglycan/LPS O-acetylase OafA/YrhL